LLIIDPQNDFHAGGSLAVPGAVEDTHRISELIRNNFDKIENVFVTLDSHNPHHIAHAVFWSNQEDGQGAEPVPFQLISNEDIVNRRWLPKDITLYDHCVEYSRALEEKGRFKLTIWPQHCLIGSVGQQVVPELQTALDLWSVHSGKQVQLIHKGMNNLTEMYSAVKAEVPLSADLSTDTNVPFVQELAKATKLVVCGQALSHCVNYTTRDVVDNWGSRSTADIVLLKDAASAVPGCQAAADQFITDMTAAGVTVINCDELV